VRSRHQRHARARFQRQIDNLPLLGNRPKSARATFCSFRLYHDTIVSLTTKPTPEGKTERLRFRIFSVRSRWPNGPHLSDLQSGNAGGRRPNRIAAKATDSYWPIEQAQLAIGFHRPVAIHMYRSDRLPKSEFTVTESWKNSPAAPCIPSALSLWCGLRAVSHHFISTAAGLHRAPSLRRRLGRIIIRGTARGLIAKLEALPEA